MTEATNGLFGAGFRTLESALTAHEHLQTARAANIANADTPNYQADSRSFADFLATQQKKNRGVGMVRTKNGHMSGNGGAGLDLNITNHAHSSGRMDGNSVNIQKEMTQMAEAQLQYELTLRLIKGKLGGLANAIKEGR
ncbi:MAG: flagellar basal body rod protein FlgB [Flavobacteriales bacterium]